FIGTGWQVDDSCALECAQWFYARALGLGSPIATGTDDAVIPTSRPATIGDALREARARALARNRNSSSWGAYQHYGRVRDKLLAHLNIPAAGERERAVTLGNAVGNASPKTFPQPAIAGVTSMPAIEGADPNLVYVNGIDRETGRYAFT